MLTIGQYRSAGMCDDVTRGNKQNYGKTEHMTKINGKFRY